MSTRRRLAAVPEQPRRAVLYVRVSALMDRGGETFHSPDLQLDAMRALAARNALQEVEVVQDIDRSGRTFAREGVDRLMELARAGQIDVVAVYDLSRFGRNTAEALRHIKELRELGVSVISTVERIDDSPEGQFMLGQFLGMAQLYSDQIGRRWQQVIAHRARQGHWHGSNPPTGYLLDGGLKVDPLVGPAVTEAFERYARGELVSHIAKDLGRLRGKVMPYTMLKRAFANPVYIGQVRNAEGTFGGVHERLVDDVTWQRVQRRLVQDSRTPSRRLAVSHSLVGLVVCDHCDHHLQLHSNPAVPAREPRGGQARAASAVLQCKQRLFGGEQVCPGPGTPHQARVEAAVREQLLPLLEGLAVDPARPALKAAATADLGRLRRELARTESALGRLAVDHARREVNSKAAEVAYRLASAELEAAAEGLQAQIDELERVAGAPAARQQVRQAKALLAAWDALTIAEQNRGLRLLLKEVRVRRAVRYREPEADRIEIIPIS